MDEKEMTSKSSVNTKYIKIASIDTYGNILEIKLEFSKSVERYFLTNEFIAEYDINIDDVEKCILSIPVISTIIPVAWAIGADIYIGDIDQSYLNSINKIEQVFRKWFPKFSFSGKIHTQNIVNNKFDNKEHALLFSGGVDSLTSYVRNRSEKPSLISIWGADIPISKQEFWNRVKRELVDFANKENINFHYIKSNAKEMVNTYLLIKEYEVEGWWLSVSHGLILLSQCAPLTRKSIGIIHIASSQTENFKEPRGSHPYIDNNLSWGCIRIVHDSYGLSRQDKIRVLKDHSNYLRYLRVCWEQHSKYNCGRCEKCLRTITGLILENIDPRMCNFDIDNNIFNIIKDSLTKGKFRLTTGGLWMWKDIQDHIIDGNTDTDIGKIYGAYEFFTWFKAFDMSGYRYKGFTVLEYLKYIKMNRNFYAKMLYQNIRCRLLL